MRYNILLEIPVFDHTADYGPMIKAWRKTARSIVHLFHLNTLKWSFRSLQSMEDFVKAVHPILQELHATGTTMKFRVEDSKKVIILDWEPASATLERYPSVLSPHPTVFNFESLIAAAVPTPKLKHPQRVEAITEESENRGVWD